MSLISSARKNAVTSYNKMCHYILIPVVYFAVLKKSVAGCFEPTYLFPPEFLRQYTMEYLTLNRSIIPEILVSDRGLRLPWKIITSRLSNSMTVGGDRDKSILTIFLENLNDLEYFIPLMVQRGSSVDLHHMKSRQRIIFIHLAAHAVENNFNSVPALVSPLEGALDFFQHDRTIFFVISGSSPEKRLIFWELYHIRFKWVWEQVDDKANILAISSRRSNFLGVSLKLLLKELNTDSPRSDGRWETLGKILLLELSHFMNYRAEIIKSEKFITEGQDGSVRGMGAELLSHHADIIATTSEIIEYRVRSLAASQPVIVVTCGLFFRPMKMISVKNVFAQAFERDLWIAAACTWFAVPFAFLLIVQTKRILQSFQTLPEDDLDVSQNIIMWSIGLACQQGWQTRPSSVSLQLILMSGLFAAMILNVLFSSSIIAIFYKDPHAFHDVFDLLKYGYTFMIQARARSVWASIQTTARVPREEQVDMPVVETAVAIQRLLTTQSALLTVPSYFFESALEGTNSSVEELCKLESDIKLDWALSRAAIYYRKDDALRTFLNWKQAMWKERGLALRHESIYFRESTPDCTPTLDFNTIHLFDIRWAFYLFVFGLSIAFIFIAFELFWTKTRSKI